MSLQDPVSSFLVHSSYVGKDIGEVKYLRCSVSENTFILLSHLDDSSVEYTILVIVLQKCESVVLLSFIFSVVL